MNDPRIGTVSEKQGISYPTQTVSGRPITDTNGLPMHNIGGGMFVMFDIFPQVGFDLDSALAEIKASVSPTPVAKVSSKPAPPVSSEG